MSGPTTAVYDTAGEVIAGATGLAAVVLAARAIKEARDMYVEYGEAHKRVCEREASRRQQRQQLQEAKRQYVVGLHRKAERLEAKLSRMQALLPEQAAFPAAPPRPAGQDEGAWNAYLAALEVVVSEVEGQLPSSRELSTGALAALTGEQPDAGQILAAYAQQVALHGRLGAEEAAHYQELTQRLLARLELEAGEALPLRIESLACEMLQAGDAARAEALATELRLEIQRANRQKQQQKIDADEARRLLDQLTEELPDELCATLERVAAGVILLDDPMRTALQGAREEIMAARKLEEQESIALVLEQSLRDLGYEVEDIAQTLFVSGGMIHFQKASWQNYYVRMRVSTADKTVNFNVVRAQGSGDATADKRFDHLAEDRWCSEFPALLKTLEARGVKLNVTRLLQAGEVPVQVVNAATLPATRREEEWRPEAALKQRQL